MIVKGLDLKSLSCGSFWAEVGVDVSIDVNVDVSINVSVDVNISVSS